MAKRNHNPFLGDDSLHWKDKRFDYTSGNLDYIGNSLIHKASTSSSNLWYIWKYTYDGSSNLTRIEGPLPGNWEDRATLDWN